MNGSVRQNKTVHDCQAGPQATIRKIHGSDMSDPSDPPKIYGKNTMAATGGCDFATQSPNISGTYIGGTNLHKLDVRRM